MKRLNQVPAANWDLALPNGQYTVRLVMGDPSFQDQTNHIKIEGVTYTDTDPYDDDQDVDAFGDFDEVTRTVTITDGKLTLSPSSGCYNTKLAFIEVTPLSGGGGSATPGLASATYKYDVLGRRAQKTVGSVTTTFVHAGDQVVAEYDGTSLARHYIYGTYIDEPLAMVTSAGTQYYHHSRIYSVMAISNQSGQLAERYGYTPYGKRRVVSPGGATLAASAVGNQVGFTGRYHDAETGLTYFRARYMDAELGRFVGRDPKRYADGQSLYRTYFIPNHLDPTGTKICSYLLDSVESYDVQVISKALSQPYSIQFFVKEEDYQKASSSATFSLGISIEGTGMSADSKFEEGHMSSMGTLHSITASTTLGPVPNIIVETKTFRQDKTLDCQWICGFCDCGGKIPVWGKPYLVSIDTQNDPEAQAALEALKPISEAILRSQVMSIFGVTEVYQEGLGSDVHLNPVND